MVKITTTLPPKTEFKSFPFELKSVDEDQGIITGYLSTYSVDEQKDRVIHGAFKKTISEAKSRVKDGRRFLYPVLWMHSPDQPIGGVKDASEDEHGLLITAQLDISTNAQGIPNNQIATMVFSGFKSGFIDEMSMGYNAIQKEYDNSGIRNLKECRLVEASAVTMLFAANPEAIVPAEGVKSMNNKSIYNEQKEQIGYIDTDEEGNDRFVLFDQKGASGKTSWPLAPRDTAWDKGQAMKDIQEYAKSGDDLNWSKVASCFFWTAKSPPEKLGDCKMPFVKNVGGKMMAVPQGIISCAGVIQGAMGGANIDDVAGVKSKIKTYYSKMDMTVPWESSDKNNNMLNEHKDFDSHYSDAMAKDVLEDWFDLVYSLKYASMDLFTIGDQPMDDAKAALEQFGTAYLAWIQRGIDTKLSDYLAAQIQSQNQTPSYGYSYSSRNDMPDFKHYIDQLQRERKKGARISQATAENISNNVDALKGIAQQHVDMADQHKALQKAHTLATKAINNVADDLSAVLGETAYDDQGANEDEEADAARNGKSRREPRANAALTQQPDNTTANELAQLQAWLEAKVSK